MSEMSEMSERREPKKLRPLMAGDVVRLRSGGPLMTVAFIDPDYSRIDCSWFWRSTRYSQSFTFSELTRVEGEQYEERVRRRLDLGFETRDQYVTVPLTRAAGDSQEVNSGENAEGPTTS